MNKVIRLKFNFINTNGIDIFGEMYLPLVGNKVYKASKVILTSGYIDTKHRTLSGASAKVDRDYKETLIKKTVATHDPEIFEINSPIAMKLPMGNIGFVKLTSLLSGYHTNKSARIVINESETSLIDNYPLGKIFQRLTKAPLKNYGNLPVITFSEFSKDFPEYIKKLVYKVNKNISSTAIEANNE